MGDTAVVFPGQGAQSVGMGEDIAASSPRARALFDRASTVLGFDIATLCFSGPAERLEQTDIQQPAIFVMSAAVWEAYLEAGGTRERFTRTGGLSLGEYTALYVAGAVQFEDAVRLVRRRGQLMQQAAEAAPSGMVSLIGADEQNAAALCERARESDVLAPANFNCPGQIVISGSKSACDRAVTLAAEFNCRAIALAVAGAFHSSLMQPAADGLAAVLAEVEFTEPSMPVVSNVHGGYHGDAASIRESLRRQVTEPVLWQRCVERMTADGVDRFVEMGPGRVLTGLLRKIDREMSGRSMSSAVAVSELVAEA